eukprot:177532_1
MQNVKCVIVGSATVGKTSLIITYTTNAFPGEYYYHHWDTPTVNIMVDNKPVCLSLWDTAGQEDYDRLRPLSYPQTDIFLLCFAVNSRSSFEELKNKFKPEVEFHCPGAPYIIVGLKSDLREDKQMLERYDFVTTEEAELLCKQFYGLKYIECSSLKQVNLDELFLDAIKAALYKNIIPYSANPYNMANIYDINKNRKRFQKYHIYDLKMFIFMILCMVIDIILSTMYVITIINIGYSPLYRLYSVFIASIIVLIAVFVYCSYGIRVSYKTFHNSYPSPCERILWMCKFILIVLIWLPLVMYVTTFWMIGYLLYHYMRIKFSYLPSSHLNDVLYIDLFTILNSKYRTKENRNDYLLCLALINNELSQQSIMKDIPALDDYVSEILDNTNGMKQINEQELESIIVDRQSNDDSFVKYLFFNVYNSLLIIDYKRYHNSKKDNLTFHKSWWKTNKLFGIFYCVLLPIYILSQFSRILFCIYYHKYSFILDIFFVLLLLIIIVWFGIYILPFHLNAWKIGYNQTLTPRVHYSQSYKVLKIAHDKYREYGFMNIKSMLRGKFGLDVARIICGYAFDWKVFK